VSRHAAPAPVDIDAGLLRRWPLAALDAAADKEARGAILVIAGSRELAGAALLAATASLRAGAGKLVVATAAGVAPGLALAMPEARVVALTETRAGGLAVSGVDRVEPLVERADALLVGPGLTDERATHGFVKALLARSGAVPLVLDASAIAAASSLAGFDRPALLTPHAGEMAHLTGVSKETIVAEPQRHAQRLARELNVVVALKGACTIIAAPDGRCWRHAKAVPGLATSGSGDVLAGIVAGFMARGADPSQAAAWAVWLHSRAATALQCRLGPLGYLARELAAEVPGLLRRLTPTGGRS